MEFENRYSLLDRLLHSVAFNSQKVQFDLAGLESRIFASELEGLELDRPVFISGLPRSGTTLLLNACCQLNGFASHRYSDMPFVMLPLLWNRFSRHFGRVDEPRERAQGDGMLINQDSPEAFEETVWKTGWSDHYLKDRIIPWDNQGHTEFQLQFADHLRKITILRRRASDAQTRYVSKNNVNIARIGWILEAFPDAQLIVPFRDGVQQSISSHRVHMKFLQIHSQDRFAARYMAGIGHYDFGENLKPIDFNGWIDAAVHTDPGKLGFWLEYWTNSYRHLIGNPHSRLHFVSYDALCQDPARSLSRLADILELDMPEGLISFGRGVKKPSPREVEITAAERGIVAEMASVQQTLNAMSIG